MWCWTRTSLKRLASIWASSSKATGRQYTRRFVRVWSAPVHPHFRSNHPQARRWAKLNKLAHLSLHRRRRSSRPRNTCNSNILHTRISFRRHRISSRRHSISYLGPCWTRLLAGSTLSSSNGELADLSSIHIRPSLWATSTTRISPHTSQRPITCRRTTTNIRRLLVSRQPAIVALQFSIQLHPYQ